MAAGLVSKIQQSVDLYKSVREQFVQIKQTGEQVVLKSK